MSRGTTMQTSGLAKAADVDNTAPVLLLGLGNPLMSDDGAGQEVLARLESEATAWGSRVEFMDGGTQGLALLGRFEGRKAVVFLDAIRLGDKAGAVHVLDGAELLSLGGGHATTAHEGSAPQILAALQLLGEAPQQVAMVGIEPAEIKTGIGLSAAVEANVGVAASFARMTITKILAAA
jgi:hydrogenase maturation protease